MDAMLTHAIDHLRAVWDGPTVRLAVGDQTYLLGSTDADADPDAEVIVRRPELLRRLLVAPSVVFGEAYTAGDIEVAADQLKHVLHGAYQTGSALQRGMAARLMGLLARWSHGNDPRRALANARHHYDLGNDFYRLWLDRSLTYSCAYFLHDDDALADAQRQKLELLCRKTRLEPGQTLLDIGCGWGGLLFHAAKHYGVHATGITASVQQADHIEAQIREQGLERQVRVIRGDWRQLDGEYDRIVSVGMFEHVGKAHYPAFFDLWRQRLNPGGLSLLHAIGRMTPAPGDAWIRRHIFPGGYLPALTQITHHADEADLAILDVENLRRHYARTLAAWSSSYQAVWDEVARMFDERFARMWWLYLQGSEAGFRWGDLQLWQVVMARDHDAPWPLNRNIAM